MLKRLRQLNRLILAGLVLASLGLWLTRPQPLAPDALDGLAGDPLAGAAVFAAAGCASCHMAPGVVRGDDPVLAGGRRFASPFGTFIAPNISSDPEAGIGGWSDIDLASAIMRGVSPAGEHLYPAFPYNAYLLAEIQDVANLIAYLRSLPADATPSQPHEVGFPFNIRLALGGWKLLFGTRGWTLDGALGPQERRGRYLVEALGHCAECHTPRNRLGGLERGLWLAGAPNPAGEGRIPNITPGGLDWSEAQIVAYLQTGFTPDFDSAGGEMVDVIANMRRLPEQDLAAIAAYLKLVPPVVTAAAEPSAGN